MAYSFASLSPADFEDLARDLIGAELGVRFEAFGPGPDGGADGRHSKIDENILRMAERGGSIVLQAKHYRLSDFKALEREMKRERGSIDALKPARYLLATSRPLTPPNKDALATIIGPSLTSLSDIYGPEDLNALLRKFPEIEKAHVKLWLTGAGVLERVLHASTHNFTAATKDEIENKIRVYAENPSFGAGRDILEGHKVLIVSGPPGVGKTTLAEMLSYAYMREGWELVAIRSLEEGFAKLASAVPQVFFFDDFLGRVALDARTLSLQDSELGRFIARVRRSPNARFILTTRAYIYEEARRLSETLGDSRLNVSRYVLDVGIYTRRIKARILYNHLFVAGVPGGHIRSLVEGDNLREIIDHKNYNPRIVEWMTDDIRIADTPSSEYATKFIELLNNPEGLWDTAFRTHIPRKCQNLLIALYFCSEYGPELEDARDAFELVHPILCKKFNIPSGPKDFEEALKTLEGSFVVIARDQVSFINPSVRDYLSSYLTDKALLISLAAAAPTCRWSEQLVTQFEKIGGLSASDWSSFLTGLVPLAQRLDSIPMWKPIPSRPTSYRYHDTSTSHRIELLLSWWRRSDNDVFLEAATRLAQHRRGLSAWEDARLIPELIATLRLSKPPERQQTQELEDALIEGLVELIRGHPYPDDLERLFDSVDKNREGLPIEIATELSAALQRMLDGLDFGIDQIDAEDTLEEYASGLEALAKRDVIEATRAKQALRAVHSRMDEVRDSKPEEESLSVQGRREDRFDTFDDDDLRNLFAPLIGDTD